MGLYVYRAVLVVTWWYWVSIGRYWLILDGTRSVYRAVLVYSWWYWVSIGRYWLILGGTGSVWSGAG